MLVLSWFAVCFLAALFHPGLSISGVGLDFLYPAKDYYLSPRALLVYPCGHPIRQLVTTDLTFCLYVFIEDSSDLSTVSLVSFSSREGGEYNEILLELEYKEKYVNFIVHASGTGFLTLPPLNKWTHICISWSSSTGTVTYYLDGVEVGLANDIQKGKKVGGQGFLTVGQDQDDYNGGFQPETGLQGRLTQFHMWDRVLGPNEVSQVRRCGLEGNVVNWENSTWSLLDGLQLIQSNSPCRTASSSAACG